MFHSARVQGAVNNTLRWNWLCLIVRREIIPGVEESRTCSESKCVANIQSRFEQQREGIQKETYQLKKRRIKADSHVACRAHVVLLPCRAAKGLECVFPI